jgi:hypothetical protein
MDDNPYKSPTAGKSPLPTVGHLRRAIGIALIPLGVFLVTLGALNALSWEHMGPESRARAIFSLGLGAFLMIGGVCLALIRR